jgi:hypothetical protein
LICSAAAAAVETTKRVPIHHSCRFLISSILSSTLSIIRFTSLLQATLCSLTSAAFVFASFFYVIAMLFGT